MSQPRDDRQDDLFRPPLEEIINLRHPLVGSVQNLSHFRNAEARLTRPEGHVATGSLSRGQSYWIESNAWYPRPSVGQPTTILLSAVHFGGLADG